MQSIQSILRKCVAMGGKKKNSIIKLISDRTSKRANCETYLWPLQWYRYGVFEKHRINIVQLVSEKYNVLFCNHTNTLRVRIVHKSQRWTVFVVCVAIQRHRHNSSRLHCRPPSRCLFANMWHPAEWSRRCQIANTNQFTKYTTYYLYHAIAFHSAVSGDSISSISQHTMRLVNEFASSC